MFTFASVVAETPKTRRARPSPAPVKKPVEEVYLREWRNRMHRTLQSLAEEIGTDKGTLSEVETRKGPEGVKARMRWAVHYAEALGVSVGKLLHHPDDPPRIEDMVADAPPDVQEHIRGLIAMLGGSRPA